MMRISMNLFEKHIIECNFGKLNIIYGHSNSGKTQFINQLIEGFNLKTKSGFTVNGSSVTKNEYDIILIDSSQSIIEQLKFASKSLLRKILFSKINDKVILDDTIVQNINEYCAKLDDLINPLVDDLNQNTVNGNLHIQLHLDSFDDIIANLVKFYFSEEDELLCSTSMAKELLYSLIYIHVKSDERQKIILIDNFDSEIDEEVTINVINNLKRLLDLNVTFILTTNKPTSLSYIVDVGKVFCMKNDHMYDLSKLDSFLKETLRDNNSTDIHTFEEYILNSNFFVDQDELSNIYESLKRQIQYNLGRMVTSRHYHIESDGKTNRNEIVIHANNEIELKFYRIIDDYINPKIITR